MKKVEFDPVKLIMNAYWLCIFWSLITCPFVAVWALITRRIDMKEVASRFVLAALVVYLSIIGIIASSRTEQPLAVRPLVQTMKIMADKELLYLYGSGVWPDGQMPGYQLVELIRMLDQSCDAPERIARDPRENGTEMHVIACEGRAARKVVIVRETGRGWLVLGGAR